MSSASTVADVLLISGDPKEAARIEGVCKNFQYDYSFLDNFEKIFESGFSARMVILSHTASISIKPSEMAQGVRQVFPSAFLAVILPDGVSKEDASFLRKSGVDLTTLSPELFQTSKFEFAINQYLRATFLPMKSLDLVVDTEIPFTVYHLIPERKKFLPCHQSGFILTSEKLKKLQHFSEFYFHRSESAIYKEFVEETSDKSALGLAKRCRVNFIALQVEFTNLVLLLSNQSEIASFTEGQELLSRCKKLCDDLLANLAEFPKAWEIINNSAIGEFGSLERGPSLAAYAGLFALNLSLNQISELMLVALLADIGLITMPPEITKKIREESELTPEELAQFCTIPDVSLKMILDRKLSLEEKWRNVLLSVNERADGKGYPKGITDSKLSNPSQLIRFSRDFDRRLQLKLGKARVNPIEALKTMVTSEAPGVSYSEKFLDLLRGYFLKEGAFGG